MAEDSHGMGIPLPADSTKIHQFPGVTRNAMERVAEILAGGMTPQVEAAIANGVATVIPGAVAQEIIDAKLLSGAETTTGDVSLISFVDANGRRLWLEVAPNGGPTDHAAALIAPAIAPLLDVPGTAKPMPEESGYLFTIVDAQNRILFGARTDASLVGVFPEGAIAPSENATYTADTAPDANGRLQVRVSDRRTGVATLVTTSPSNKYRPRLTADNNVVYLDDNADLTKPKTARYVPATGGTSWPYVAGPRFAAFGDSLTAGGWPQKLGPLIGVTVDNWGIGGQTSRQIAARSNAIPAALTLAGNEIPAAATPVSVTAGGNLLVRPADPSLFSATNGGAHNAFGITLAGIPGTLAVTDAGAYTFTRTTAGAVVPVPAGTLAYTAHGEQARGDGFIIMAGRNNVSDPVNTIPGHVQAMIDYLKPIQKRVQIMNILPATDDSQAAKDNVARVNAELAAAFPGMVLDLAGYLRSDQAFTDTGKVKSAQDLTDIANGNTPATFRADTLHLNDTGNTAVAIRLQREFKTKGWA